MKRVGKAASSLLPQSVWNAAKRNLEAVGVSSRRATGMLVQVSQQVDLHATMISGDAQELQPNSHAARLGHHAGAHTGPRQKMGAPIAAGSVGLVSGQMSVGYGQASLPSVVESDEYAINTNSGSESSRLEIASSEGSA